MVIFSHCLRPYLQELAYSGAELWLMSHVSDTKVGQNAKRLFRLRLRISTTYGSGTNCIVWGWKDPSWIVQSAVKKSDIIKKIKHWFACCVDVAFVDFALHTSVEFFFNKWAIPETGPIESGDKITELYWKITPQQNFLSQNLPLEWN